MIPAKHVFKVQTLCQNIHFSPSRSANPTLELRVKRVRGDVIEHNHHFPPPPAVFTRELNVAVSSKHSLTNRPSTSSLVCRVCSHRKVSGRTLSGSCPIPASLNWSKRWSCRNKPMGPSLLESRLRICLARIAYWQRPVTKTFFVRLEHSSFYSLFKLQSVDQ